MHFCNGAKRRSPRAIFWQKVSLAHELCDILMMKTIDFQWSQRVLHMLADQKMHVQQSQTFVNSCQ